MSGAADADSISTTQSGTASSSLILNGSATSGGSFTDSNGKEFQLQAQVVMRVVTLLLLL